MKVLKWRIFTRKQIDKIVKMINGIPEDREIAKTLLRGEESQINLSYPKYDLLVTVSKVILRRKFSGSENWTEIDYDYYNFENETSKKDSINRMKTKMEKRRETDLLDFEKSKFKNYTINF